MLEPGQNRSTQEFTEDHNTCMTANCIHNLTLEVQKEDQVWRAEIAELISDCAPKKSKTGR